MKPLNKTLSFLCLVCCKLTWAVLFLLHPVKLEAGPYQLREFPGDLAQPYVYSLIQDSLGYLWIGTGNGLTRYDGFSFQHYNVNDSLADNFISCSYSNGNELWFGHRNGKISYYNGSYFITLQAANLLTGITAIKQSPEGQLWASTYHMGLIKIESQQLNCDFLSPEQTGSIHSFEFIEENKIIAGTDFGVLICRLLDSGKLEVLEQFDEIPKEKIPSLIKMKHGAGFYIATESSGLFKMAINNNSFTVIPLSETQKMINSPIQQITEDNLQNLWVATFGQGLIRITATTNGESPGFRYFNQSTGFSTNYAKTVFEDPQG
jgi:ligand-binding sensor domain-containing protein